MAFRDISAASLREEIASSATAARAFLAELFDEITDGTHLGNISPMQIDEEYFSLMSKEGGGHKSREALLILWDKYPTMRSYITKKYGYISNGYFFD